MIPEITKNLLIEYLILFLILAPITAFVIIYHFSLPKDLKEDEVELPEVKEIKTEEIKPKTQNKKVDINKLYNDLKRKYNPAKAGDKKTRLRNKQMIEKIEKAYRIKDIKTLMSL